jgi:hypothetical protein
VTDLDTTPNRNEVADMVSSLGRMRPLQGKTCYSAKGASKCVNIGKCLTFSVARL